MRVIVTGASGFLGKELVKRLDECKIDFVAATTRPSVLIEEIGIAANSVVMANQLLCENFYRSDDIIMNCAFPRTNDGLAMAAGLNYLAELINCAIKGNVGGFMNISSQSVYSQHRTKPAVETDALCLESSYAVAKRGVELLLEAQAELMPYTNIRLASLIGPSFDQRVPNRVAKRAWETGQIQVADNGSEYGFMDVRDAASALMEMLSSVNTWQKTYNLSSEQCWTLLDIAEDVKRILETTSGKTIEIDYTKTQTEPVNTLVDSSLFWGSFDWRPIYDRYNSMQAIVASVVGKQG